MKKKVHSSDTIPTWDQKLDSEMIKANYEVRKAIFERIKVLYDKDLALFKEAEAKYIKYFGKGKEVTK